MKLRINEGIVDNTINANIINTVNSIIEGFGGYFIVQYVIEGDGYLEVIVRDYYDPVDVYTVEYYDGLLNVSYSGGIKKFSNLEQFEQFIHDELEDYYGMSESTGAYYEPGYPE